MPTSISTTQPPCRPRRRLRAAALALLVLGGPAFAACSSSGDDEDGVAQENSDPNDGTGASDDDTTTTTTDDSSTDDGTADDPPAESDEILGSSSGQHPTDPLDDTPVPLRIDVTGLERNGDLVELTFVMSNDADPSTSGFEPYSVFNDPRTSDGAYSISGTALVDGEGQKAYLTVLDSDGICLCTGNMSNVNIPGGGHMQMSATFGGVPESLDTVDVTVPGFAPVVDVPIGG